MDRPAGAALRWTRAAFLAAVAMLTGSVAHVSAGGYLPGPTAMAWIFLACLLASACLLGRPASPLRVAVMLMAGQTFFHGALTAMGGHRGDPPLRTAPVAAPVHPVVAPLDRGRRVGSLYDQLGAQSGTDPAVQLSVPAPVQHLLADLTGPHALMALLHLLAAALIGLWIARGERALWVVLAAGTDVALRSLDATTRRHVSHASTLRATLGLLRARELLAQRWHGPPDWSTTQPLHERILTNLVIRRGPPALLAA